MNRIQENRILPFPFLYILKTRTPAIVMIMAGRPKKKPEYNPELQFNNFLQELRDAYEEADSLRSLADELNMSLLKLRKLLITADVFTSDICTEINNLHQSGKKIPEL